MKNLNDNAWIVIIVVGGMALTAIGEFALRNKFTIAAIIIIIVAGFYLFYPRNEKPSNSNDYPNDIV